MRLFGTIISSCFLCIATNTVTGQVKIDGIAAVVGNEIVLYSEVFSLAQQEAAATGLDKNAQPEMFVELIKKWLEILIDNKIQLTRAEEDTLVVVLDEEVDAQVNRRIQSEIQLRGSEDAVEKIFGVSIAELKNKLNSRTRDELLIGRLKQNVTKDVRVTRKEIESFYDTYKDSIPPIPRVYDLSHILKIPSRPPEVVAEKRAFMDSLRQLIQNGADFAEIAKNHSDDPGSADRGGELGWNEPETFFPEFDNAVAKLDLGELSEVVKTQIGLHIIQLLGRKGNQFHTRHILTFLIITQTDVQKTSADLMSYRERALGGEDFSELALAYSDDPEVKETKGHLGEWTITRLAQFLPDFKQGIENLKEGEISEPFKSEFGYHIVKVNRLAENRSRTLEQDYDYIRELTTLQKKNLYYRNWLVKIKKETFIDIKFSINDTNSAVNDTSKTARR